MGNTFTDGYSFETRSVIDDTIAALAEVSTSKKLDCSKLTPRTDNGSQYTSTKFGSAVNAYDINKNSSTIMHQNRTIMLNHFTRTSKRNTSDCATLNSSGM